MLVPSKTTLNLLSSHYSYSYYFSEIEAALKTTKIKNKNLSTAPAKADSLSGQRRL